MARYLIVADGGEARVMTASMRREPVLEELARLECRMARPPRRARAVPAAGVAVRPIRGRRDAGSPDVQRYSAGSDLDPHVAEVARFAKRVATRLEADRKAGRIDELLLIAEPKFLGVLRPHLSASLRRLVTWELARDHVKSSETVILAALRRAKVLQEPVAVRRRRAAGAT
jgi:protein required for attachment to host cells